MDSNLVNEMIGKIVLAGITRLSQDNEVISQEQYYGKVLRISEEEGLIILRGDNQEEMWLPPALEYYRKATPGEYQLRQTGHVVLNPDYVATWHIHPGE